eukprot:s890_g15.t1
MLRLEKAREQSRETFRGVAPVASSGGSAAASGFMFGSAPASSGGSQIFAASSASGNSSGSSGSGSIFGASAGASAGGSSGGSAGSIFGASSGSIFGATSGSSAGGASAFGTTGGSAFGAAGNIFGAGGSAFGATPGAAAGQPSMFAQAFQQSRAGPGGARRRRPLRDKSDMAKLIEEAMYHFTLSPMFSDDDDGFFAGRGRSPSPEQRETRSRRDSDHRRDDRRRDEDRRRDGDRRHDRHGRDDDRPRRDDDRKRRDDDRRGRDDDRRPDFIKRDRPARTTGREIPKLYSIHKGTVVRVQDYGAFVRLGDGSTYKDGLLHISRLSSSGRVDSVADVVSQDDIVWVKVIEVKEEEGKFSLDMRFVGQKDGEDQDPGNVQADTGRGKGSGKSAPEPIRIGAIQATTCSRCGARGHAARECWSGGAGGKHYDLVEEAEPPSLNNPVSAQDLETLSKGHDASVVKAALKAYFKRKAEGKDSSSSSSSSSDKKKKKDKKKEKKQKKKEKKAKKKEKKLQKKAAKEAKKAPTEG